jgi:hypothetical protein
MWESHLLLKDYSVTKRTTIIAPRLKSGECRVRFGSRLPEEIKEGLRLIAFHERKSMSWVVEEVILDYFNLRRPKYIQRKTK